MDINIYAIFMEKVANFYPLWIKIMRSDSVTVAGDLKSLAG
jgi:hypothetical protein